VTQEVCDEAYYELTDGDGRNWTSGVCPDGGCPDFDRGGAAGGSVDRACALGAAIDALAGADDAIAVIEGIVCHDAFDRPVGY
jgi:hypothetical protein